VGASARLHGVAAFAAALLAVAAPLSAAAFDFTGPAPERNFQPIQLIFLNLPFESAATLDRGGIALLLESAEINEIATTQGPITSTLKFESNRTVFGVRYGLLDGWEAGLELPFISRFGGFLDPEIDWVESITGRVNPERKLYPHNVFGAFSVVRGHTTLFEDGEENFQPGDLVISLKHALQSPPAWPEIALRAAVKAPTGDADAILGSGKPDFGGGIAVDYHPFDRLMLYFNLDGIYPVGPITAGNLTLDPFVAELFGSQFALTQRWSLMLQQAVYTSPFHAGVRLLDGTVAEISPGLSFAYSPQLGVQLIGIENVSGVEQSADFTLLVNLVYKPCAGRAAPPPVGEGAPIPPPSVSPSTPPSTPTAPP
jgi:Protein of unknown function (DUF3187)